MRKVIFKFNDNIRKYKLYDVIPNELFKAEKIVHPFKAFDLEYIENKVESKLEEYPLVWIASAEDIINQQFINNKENEIN